MNTVVVPHIHSAMVAIMSEVGAVAKSGKNDKQNYGFRKVDDVYAALQLLMAKHGVYTTSEILNERGEERRTSSGGTLLYRILTIRYTFWCKEDGSSVTSTVIGEGMDSGDKASNKAMSVAHKYALCQAFTIPTDEPKDPENDSHDLKSDDLYNGKEDKQKIVLQNLFKVHGITERTAMIGYSDRLIKNKVKMSELPNALKELIEDPTL